MTPSSATVRGFDRLAPFYDLAADLALARSIPRSQTLLLPRLPAVRRALVVGDGTGRFLADLLRSRKVGSAVAIDASPAMMRRTRRRLERASLATRVELRVGGLERIAPGERFDLVATHCFLDLFEGDGLAAVLGRLDAALESGGLWLWSDFAAAARPAALRLAHRALVGALYAFFARACRIEARRLPDFDRAFSTLGYREVESGRVAGGLLRAAIMTR